MNANDITFGIEIETTIPTGAIFVGSYGGGNDVAALPGWKAAHDGSIHRGRGRSACEFVSPVLKGVDGIAQVQAAVAYIKSIGGKVNASCGLHVHVGFDKRDTGAVEKLTTLVANFEKAIFASTGTRSREQGHYCQPIARYGSSQSAIARASTDRYHLCNLATNKPTVEFRAFAGTLDVTKIIGHIYTCVGIVERALTAKRVTNWTARPVVATSPIHRGGEGQTALTRLFYQLGWIKGRTDHVYGQVGTAVNLRSIKRKLMALARKYDAQA